MREYIVNDLIEELNNLKKSKKLTGEEKIIIFNENGNPKNLNTIRISTIKKEILLYYVRTDSVSIIDRVKVFGNGVIGESGETGGQAVS